MKIDFDELFQRIYNETTPDEYKHWRKVQRGIGYFVTHSRKVMHAMARREARAKRRAGR